jgi:hypothetical protein
MKEQKHSAARKTKGTLDARPPTDALEAIVGDWSIWSPANTFLIDGLRDGSGKKKMLRLTAGPQDYTKPARLYSALLSQLQRCSATFSSGQLPKQKEEAQCPMRRGQQEQARGEGACSLP